MNDNISVTVSAPGKLMLFGEHAVLWGHPCLVTAVDKRVFVTITPVAPSLFELEAPDVGISGYQKPMGKLGQGDIPKEAQFVEGALKNFSQAFPLKTGIRIETRSGCCPKYGFGSSSATVVSVLSALVKLNSPPIAEKQLFQLARQTVLDVQGNGSGFDVAAALYGGMLLFQNKGDCIEPIDRTSIPLIVGYTGIKVDTPSLVSMVVKKRQQFPQKVDRIFSAIEKLVIEAKERIVEGDWERVGRLMDFNQEYLRDLGVSSEKLESLISAAKKAGALGAKLSGAGGGDCMISVAPNEKKQNVMDAISRAGGRVLDVVTGVQGVRLEKGFMEEHP